jgi:hypothetical protein
MIDDDNIYSSVDPDLFDKKYADRIKVLKFLKEHSGEMIRSKEIAEACGLTTGNTQIQVRVLITQLIEIDHEPIVANNKGFMFSSNSNQLKFYANQLQERKLGLQRRIDSVLRIAYKMDHGDAPEVLFERPVIIKLRAQIERLRKYLIKHNDKGVDSLVREAEGAIRDSSEIEQYRMLITLEHIQEEDD